MATVHPEEAVLEKGQTVRMMQCQCVGEYLSASLAKVVARLDVVEMSVGKVDTLLDQIERESVGPVEFGGDDDRAVGTVQVGALDARLLAPVAPEEVAVFEARVEAETARIAYVLL